MQRTRTRVCALLKRTVLGMKGSFVGLLPGFLAVSALAGRRAFAQDIAPAIARVALGIR